MTTTLVTAATGTVGAAAASDLVQRGATVRAFTRDPDRASIVLHPDVEIVAGDLADTEAVRLAMKGVDSVLVACGNHPRQVALETNVIDAAAEAVARVVKLSALHAEIDSPLAFWDAHGRIEQRLRDGTVAAVVLQPTYFMSNLLASAEAVRHTGQLFLPAGAAAVAMIDPRDVATVAAIALLDAAHDGATYRLTGPEALTFEEVANRLSLVTGRPVQFVDVPDAAARSAMVDAGAPEWVADNLVTLFGLLRSGLGSTVTGDVRSVTGRPPRSLADFARDHAHLFSP
jgi:uncharacterized protein YbjT (DUF2867 family)